MAKNPQRIAKWWRGKQIGLDNVANEAAEEFARVGAERMVEYISTRGTGWVGRGPLAVPYGRIDYGNMVGDVKSGVRSQFGRKTASFGWLDNKEEYYSYQERGFTHPSGKDVRGMYALADAGEDAVEAYKRVMRERGREV